MNADQRSTPISRLGFIGVYLCSSVAYTASPDCAPCHREIYDRYQSTAMARSSGATTGTFPAASFREYRSRMFYQADGTPLTLGNYLFGTNGGVVLNKPDIAAADGVTARTPGFNPFYGTSAAAPHAAGVAAIVKSAKPSATGAQIFAALTSTALDIRAPGIDRDSGYGIVMAMPAVNAILH